MDIEHGAIGVQEPIKHCQGIESLALCREGVRKKTTVYLGKSPKLWVFLSPLCHYLNRLQILATRWQYLH